VPIRQLSVPVVLGALAIAGCGGAEPPQSVAYPDTRRVEQNDIYHGVTVNDPYRWLEDIDAEDSKNWVVAQNSVTMPYLQSLPTRAAFATRMRTLIDYERFGIPQQQAGIYVYTHNTGRQEQDVIRVTDDPAEPGRVLLDPNLLAAEGTISVGDFVLSPDGRSLGYSLSDGGSDWKTWHLLDVATGRNLADELHGIKFSGISWSPDSKGFYYSRYPRKAAGSDAMHYDGGRQVTVWYHVLGEAQDADREVYRVTDHATRNPYATVTDDGLYLIIDLFDGYQANGIYFQTLHDGKPGPDTVRLLDGWDARYEFLGNDGAYFFFKTTRDAPLGRVIRIDLARPGPEHWQTVVPQTGEAIAAASLVGQTLIVRYIVDAHTRVRIFDLSGGPGGEIVLPGKGTVSGFDGRIDATATFYSYTDFTTPQSVYRYDLETGDSTVINAVARTDDAGGYHSEQVFYESRDGTLVPMYIVQRKDLMPDGRRPTVLYGYGGFNVSLLPRYSSARMAWLESGGIYAVANLRGGGEYGEAWHEAGTRLNKQTVFDDFIAAAEWLIDNGYTVPDRLAIWGGSNGGLLVAAVANQRPELFAAVIPSVGVLDMLRYHLASANARQWSSDYGLSDNAEQFQAQYAYSPYHNVRSGPCYPATLVMADANDDRVVPWHSYKYAAALQYAQRQVPGCTRPVLIRIETRTGHGGGASTTKIVDEYADQWAFVAHALGIR